MADRLDEIKARLAAATRDDLPFAAEVEAIEALEAAAPDDIAYLIGEVERLTKERDQFVAITKAALDSHPFWRDSAVRWLGDLGAATPQPSAERTTSGPPDEMKGPIP